MNTTHDTTAARLRKILADRMRDYARGRPITGPDAWMRSRSHVKASALAFLRAALPQYRGQLAQLASRQDGAA